MRADIYLYWHLILFSLSWDIQRKYLKGRSVIKPFHPKTNKTKTSALKYLTRSLRFIDCLYHFPLFLMFSIINCIFSVRSIQRLKIIHYRLFISRAMVLNILYHKLRILRHNFGILHHNLWIFSLFIEVSYATIFFIPKHSKINKSRLSERHGTCQNTECHLQVPYTREHVT